MPVIDACEPQVIRAFEKAGWVVINHPFTIRLPDASHFYADVRLQHADRQIIVVEVKCFPGTRSVLDEMYHAIGQCVVYQAALEKMDLPFNLYLALPLSVYELHLHPPTVLRSALFRAKIRLVVINLELEEIASWLD